MSLSEQSIILDYPNAIMAVAYQDNTIVREKPQVIIFSFIIISFHNSSI